MRKRRVFSFTQSLDTKAECMKWYEYQKARGNPCGIVCNDGAALKFTVWRYGFEEGLGDSGWIAKSMSIVESANGFRELFDRQKEEQHGKKTKKKVA